MTLTKPTNDYFAIANVIHELISGVRIHKLPNGKLMYHAKVKNSAFFRHVEQLVHASQHFSTVERAVQHSKHVQEQRSIQKKNNPPLRSTSCPRMHTKFV